MTWANVGQRHVLLWCTLLFVGCGDEPPIGLVRDCSADGIGCSLGFDCVLWEGGRHRCMPSRAYNGAIVSEFDASTTIPDTSVDAPDGFVRQDAALSIVTVTALKMFRITVLIRGTWNKWTETAMVRAMRTTPSLMCKTLF